MPDTKVVQVKGRAIPVSGNDIDTDRIIPARYLKEITFAKMGEYPFFDERFNADGSKKDHPFNAPRYQGASLLFVNANFGCGSSREHAPQSLLRWGVKAIVGESFAEIFSGNCNMLGVPVATVTKAEAEKLQALAQAQPKTEWTVDLGKMTLSGGGLEMKISMAEPRRQALVEGTWDSTAMLLANADRVKALAGKLPYMGNFA